MSFRQADQKATRHAVLFSLLLLLQFAGSYAALSSGLNQTFFRKIRIDGAEFFAQLIVNGIFLYALILAVSLLVFKVHNLVKTALVVFCLSLVVATLRGNDKFETHPATPDTFSGMFYSLLTDRQPVLLLAVLTMLAAAALIYYLIRSFFKVSFEGRGIQIKLPGQTMYYMAIFPQTTWQRTGIQLEEGDKILVELTGQVSPGGLQNFWYLKDDLDKFHNLQKQGQGDRSEWRKILDEKSWPYSGPEGYAESWYIPGSKVGVLRDHPIYRSVGLEDECMTIKGKPHNTVFGIIQNEEPRCAIDTIPAYVWARDQDKLYELSSRNYPKSLTVKHAGELWVVINDVDYARWDNTGMFFLRVTKHS